MITFEEIFQPVVEQNALDLFMQDIYGFFKCSSQKSQFQGEYETKLKFN